MTNTENAKFVVCPACEGEGQIGPGLVFTASDMDEQWGANFDARDDFMRRLREGYGAEKCDWCKGRAVVLRIEGGILAEDAWWQECEYRAEARAEQRMGC